MDMTEAMNIVLKILRRDPVPATALASALVEAYRQGEKVNKPEDASGWMRGYGSL